MAQPTNIEWTEQSWNFLRGCRRVSEACGSDRGGGCYAERQAIRQAKPGEAYHGLVVSTPKGPRWTGEIGFVEEILLAPLKRKKPTTYFVNSMSDLFYEKVTDEMLDKAFAIMALTPQHTYQVLTKRPERMLEYLNAEDTPFRIAQQMDAISAGHGLGPEELRPVPGYPAYFVSSHGHIYSDKRGRRRRLKPDIADQGHMRVQLHRDGKAGPRGDRLLVHRLVLEAFVSAPPSDNSQGRHRDGNPTNNAVTNLFWGDQSANWQDSMRHGTFRRYSKLERFEVDRIKERHNSGSNTSELAAEYGVSETQIRNIVSGKQWAVQSPIEWPLRNCWLGVSVEDQKTADERIPLLLQTPAALRWLSIEPLLGPIEFSNVSARSDWKEQLGKKALRGINWAVLGGESGPGARPFDVTWARSIIRQCRAAGLPVFVKQMGSNVWDVNDAGYDGDTPSQWPMGTGTDDWHLDPSRQYQGAPCRVILGDRKGGNMHEWPEDLRIREMPEVSL